jgi:two-component system nitrogen regulation response regulator NtrX
VVGDALKVVLESNGYDVVLVKNGRAGIIEANRRRFAVGIIDLFLSDISGLQAIESIKTKQPEFPIILMTGNGRPEAFAAARQLGVLGILEKPFGPDEILELITRASQT